MNVYDKIHLCFSEKCSWLKQIINLHNCTLMIPLSNTQKKSLSLH